MNRVKARTRGQRPSWRAVAMITVVGLLGFAPVSASASDDVDETEVVVQLFSEAQCSSGAFCVWSADNYLGVIGKATSTASTSTGYQQARSLWNRSGRAARAYSGTGATGAWVCFDPGAKTASTWVAARSVVLLSGSRC